MVVHHCPIHCIIDAMNFNSLHHSLHHPCNGSASWQNSLHHGRIHCIIHAMALHHGRIHCIMAEFIASSMQWHCIMAEFIASWMQWRAEGDHESCGRQINKYTFIVDIFRCASVQCISIHFGWILERRLSINRFADKVLPLCIESKCVSLLWCTLGLLN